MTISIENCGPALLFCPGDRPERFVKAATAADIAVLDLEDGVAEANKDAARLAIVQHLRAEGSNGNYAVRINLPATARGQADAQAVTEAGARILLLPKTETLEELDNLAAWTGCELIASIETARGLSMVGQIARHESVRAISWGPYDLAADMGFRAVRDAGNALLPTLINARDQVIFAAAVGGIGMIDTVTAELKDLAVVERDAAEGALLGFRGKFAIHPSQVPIIRNAYRPSEHDIARSRRMLDAVAGRGVFLFEGEMVDEPMLRRARRILAAAGQLA